MQRHFDSRFATHIYFVAHISACLPALSVYVPWPWVCVCEREKSTRVNPREIKCKIQIFSPRKLTRCYLFWLFCQRSRRDDCESLSHRLYVLNQLSCFPTPEFCSLFLQSLIMWWRRLWFKKSSLASHNEHNYIAAAFSKNNDIRVMLLKKIKQFKKMLL